MNHIAKLIALCLVAPLWGQDALQLKDGRFVFDQPMTRNAEGVVIHYQSGDILVPKDMVLEAVVSKQEGGGEVELSEKAKDKMEKGFVLHNGRWVKKTTVERIRKREHERRREKIEEALKHQKWANRYQEKTRHFAFEYTIDPAVVENYKTLMETYYKVFTREWKIRPAKGIGKLKVCFYHDPEYYYQVSGAPYGAIGYFRFVDPIELNFYYDRLDERLTLDVMFHEANHFLTYLIDPKFYYPIWINEALAEYYGASQWDPTTRKMSIGHIQEGRLTNVQDEIAKDNWMGLEDLMRTPQSRFSATHYAWGWSFVHYLLQNKKYARNFKRYYLALAQDKSIKKVPFNGDMRTVEPDEAIAAFKKFMKIRDLKDLEQEWYEHIKAMEPSSHRGYLRAGQIAMRYDMPIKARRYFETAIEKGSQNPNAWVGLAQALSRKGKWTEAVDAWKKTVKLDPLNGIYYLRLARAMTSAGADDKDEEVVRLRKLALEIDPDDYEVIMEAATWDLLDKVVGGDGKADG